MKKLFMLSMAIAVVAACDDEDEPLPENPADTPYEVVIDPDNFLSSTIDGNQYFSLVSGKTMIYEGEGEDGEMIRVEEIYTNDTKEIMGVTCVVVNAKEYEDGELIEDTFDWYAEDREGNVWYFGEDSKEIENGVVVSSSGSWEAGVDGALPGIIMMAKPIVGLWYRQEYYQGEAEDVAQVLSVNATVSVPLGTFTGCLQTAEWNLLEPGVVEHKFYAPGTGLVQAVAVKGDASHEDLVEIN